MTQRGGMTRREALALAGAAAVGEIMPFTREEPPMTQPANTLAHIACICQNGDWFSTVEEHRRAMLARAEEAAALRPDLICLPEAFTSPGVPGAPATTAEPVPGPTTDAFAALARRARCYILCAIHTRRGKAIYNSVIVLGRNGDIEGIYDKYCPVTSSADYTVLEGGVLPGKELPVFDLDFGRIGVQICFDIGFPENWATLARKGARLIVWSSAYDGGFPLQAYAHLHRVWVATATRSQRSRIIDPCGQIAAETTPPERLVWRVINLDYAVCHRDWNYSVPDRIRSRYGDRVDVREWLPGTSHFLVEPRDPAVRVSDLKKEFGFEELDEYHERHRKTYRSLRRGQRPSPQRALHGNRPQYAP